MNDSSQYTFEENLTRPDLPVKCYFVYTRQESKRRPTFDDLVIPSLNKGHFKTPTPSPAGTPVEDIIVVTSSPPIVNSPDHITTKFKVGYFLFSF